MAQIALDDIESVTRRALERHGAEPGVAASVADAVRVSESKGNRICGLYYVTSYCQQLETGRIDGATAPTVDVAKPGAVRVDGKLGFAQPAFAAGFEAAVASARANGVCGFSVEHTHTCTALGYFTEQFAAEGLIAIGTTNASPRVAAPGGKRRVLGTNPMAMAVPNGDGGIAFQFDFSTSAVALGRITMANEAGESIPEGWAVDADGNPTTDPAAALEGAMLSAGGYKGFGLGLMVEVLASALTGGRASVDVPPLKTPEGAPHDLGQFYLVIDPAAFAGEAFHDAVAALAEVVEQDEPARLPGRGFTAPTAVEVDADFWAGIVALAGD